MDNEISPSPGFIDCACVIHDVLYSWEYVDKLYRGLQRNLNVPVRMHVYTEEERPVPNTMVKHVLEEWPGVRGPKRSWWYKLQLFNTKLFAGNLMYFDLDTVITDNIDWIWKLPTDYFWALKDFQYLYRRNLTKINSSVMWVDNTRWKHLYDNIEIAKLKSFGKHYGDQDYIFENIPQHRIRYLDPHRVNSWRWQAHDGGWNFISKKPKQPGLGTQLNKDVSVLVFHGDPKPHEVQDIVVRNHWK